MIVHTFTNGKCVTETLDSVPKRAPDLGKRKQHYVKSAKVTHAPGCMSNLVAGYMPRGTGGADNRWIGSKGAAGPRR